MNKKYKIDGKRALIKVENIVHERHERFIPIRSPGRGDIHPNSLGLAVLIAPFNLRKDTIDNASSTPIHTK